LCAQENCFAGTVDFVSYLGAVIDLRVRLSPADAVLVTVPNRAGGFAPGEGTPVFVHWPPEAGLVYREGDGKV
jgi:putative spermidine/putrescine transport system ATP-binding protein